MVDSRTPGVVIDQALHGYRQGHRLLAASTTFDPDSEAQLMALSDLLTSEPLGPSDSYLSGYPLKSANKYVLARTWLAGEGARPGSVWTHSLLLDYSSLSALDDVMPLLSLFRRPAPVDESPTTYAVRLIVRPAHGGIVDMHARGVTDDLRVPRVLHHLYGRAAIGRFVIPAGDAARDECLAMALWRQMWPGLRRDFAFFTKGTPALGEVPAGSALCFSDDPGLSMLFNNRALSTDPYEVEGFARLLRDLPRRGPTRLRRFLGRYAYDVAKPRSVVPALATLFTERKKPRNALASFQRLLGAYPGIDRLKRELLLLCVRDRQDTESLVGALKLFATEPSFISDQALEDAMRQSPMVESNAARLLATVAHAPSDTIGHQAFIALARQLPLPLLASQANTASRDQLLALRPELASQPQLWEVTEADRVELLQQAVAAGIGGAILLQGMGPRLSSQEAQTILAYEPALAVSLWRMIGLGQVPLRAADGLGVFPGILEQLAHAGLTVPWDVLERIAEPLVRAGHVCDAGVWCALTKHLERGPDTTHPYVLGQLFMAGLDSSDEEHLLLCEQAFDSLWTISERYPGLPRELTALLCDRPIVRKEYSYPSLLLGTAWTRYRKSTSGRVMALSAHGDRLSRLARYIRRCDGEDALKRIAQQVRRHQAQLQLSVPLVEVALDDAMPFFSAKLPRGPKR